MKLLVAFGIFFALALLADAMPHHEPEHDGDEGHDGEPGHDGGHDGHSGNVATGAEHEHGQAGHGGKGGDHDGAPGVPAGAPGIPVAIVHDEHVKYAADSKGPEVPDIFLHVPIQN